MVSFRPQPVISTELRVLGGRRVERSRILNSLKNRVARSLDFIYLHNTLNFARDDRILTSVTSHQIAAFISVNACKNASISSPSNMIVERWPPRESSEILTNFPFALSFKSIKNVRCRPFIFLLKTSRLNCAGVPLPLAGGGDDANGSEAKTSSCIKEQLKF